MSEASVVGSLITRLIAAAIALGAAGTLIDEVLITKHEAQEAVLHRGISYSKWNRKLQERK